MSEGVFARQQKQQLEHDNDSLRQDIDELRQNIQKVVQYMEAWPADEGMIAYQIRILELLNIGEPVELRQEDQLEIFEVEVSAEEASEQVQQTLTEWAADAEKQFNKITVQDSEGLRQLAAREQGGEHGTLHERTAPGDG